MIKVPVLITLKDELHQACVHTNTLSSSHSSLASLAAVPGNVSEALILIPLHVPSLISVWAQLPTEPQPGGGPGRMGRPRLCWAAEQLRHRLEETPSLS